MPHMAHQICIYIAVCTAFITGQWTVNNTAEINYLGHFPCLSTIDFNLNQPLSLACCLWICVLVLLLYQDQIHLLGDVDGVEWGLQYLPTFAKWIFVHYDAECAHMHTYICVHIKILLATQWLFHQIVRGNWLSISQYIKISHFFRFFLQTLSSFTSTDLSE